MLGQNFAKNDSINLFYSLKFKVLEKPYKEISPIELKKIDSIIYKTDLLKIKKIASKGFYNVDFYKIVFKTEFEGFQEEYIIGYQKEGKNFFKLKGFLNNDFYYLYKFESRINSKSPINLESKKNKRLFLENHFIEELDLECLIKHLKDKENWKIPCLNPSQKIILDDYGEEHYK
jgi:hypothetical protein